MKNYLIYHICQLNSDGFTFSHTRKMKIETICNISYMNYKNYLKLPMQIVERTLILKIAEIPKLINSLKTGSDHPSTRKLIHIPFTD